MSLDGTVDLAGHLGGMVGGYTGGLALFPGIKPKPRVMTMVGCGSLATYLLVMFLVFYLWSSNSCFWHWNKFLSIVINLIE